MKQMTKVVLATVAITGLVFAGDVTGKVSFDGKAPTPTKLQMNADPVCKKAHAKDVFGEDVVVNSNGTLKNVIVYVKDGLGGKTFPAPPTKLIFDQSGCQYVPHVLSVSTGQEVEIRNSDPTLHNVHSLSKLNPQFNQGQPSKNMKMTKKFDKAETFKVKCEVHTWMGAYMGVFNHPFHAVTGADGSFSLRGLPAGDYTIEAWHEKYGIQSGKVKVDAASKATLDFKFKG